MSAQEARDGEIVEVAPDQPEEAKAKKSKKKKLLIIGAAAAVVLLGGGGTAYALLGADTEQTDGSGDHAEADKGDAKGGHGDATAEAFVDVPPMVVNLRSADGGARFIKLHFMLVPGPKGEVEALTDKLPLLLDAYQPFLRELRPEDLAGSAAVFRIKEELLVRARDTLGDGYVKDVLIQDLIQQ